MIVDLNTSRFVHLAILVLLSISAGYVFKIHFEWSNLVCHSLAVTIVCNINSAVIKLLRWDTLQQEDETLLAAMNKSNRIERRITYGSNKKKKSRKKLV
mmetsp:Transcript_19456/g.44312  ORF Transcript_19456/g.44312 Transcript_19456/m.44312 type:complete len:99 (+) Transcript_19456:46-342(+)